MYDMKFNGIVYRTADNWFNVLDMNQYAFRPIRYLEIGTFYGANLLTVAHSYGEHEFSELHCIDPWCDYPEYSEYQGQQDEIYAAFMSNIENSLHRDKIHVHRGFSHNEIPKFEDDYFDLIYIDGNHNADAVLEDAVLAFRKLRTNGIIIFDDYTWSLDTTRGIDCFLSAYRDRINLLGDRADQVFIQKI